jgi:HEAT repeat protein
MNGLSTRLVLCTCVGLLAAGAGRAAEKPDAAPQPADGSAELQRLAVQALQGPDEDARAEAVHALGQRKDPRSIGTLAAAMDDESLRVRNAAMFALREIPDPRVIGPLMSVVRDPQASRCIRGCIASNVARIEDPRAVEWLVSTLNDPAVDPYSRCAAAYGLGLGLRKGTIKHPLALRTLAIAAVDDESPDVRTAAITQLKSLLDQAQKTPAPPAEYAP